MCVGVLASQYVWVETSNGWRVQVECIIFNESVWQGRYCVHKHTDSFNDSHTPPIYGCHSRNLGSPASQYVWAEPRLSGRRVSHLVIYAGQSVCVGGAWVEGSNCVESHNCVGRALCV